MGHKYSTTAVRNRAIYAAFQAGESLESIARQWGLLVRTLRAIIRQERHKMAVSAEEFYRARRRAAQLMPLTS